MSLEKMRALLVLPLLLVVTGFLHTPTHALDNGLARTPPMGFSTWSVFRSAVNESLVRYGLLCPCLCPCPCPCLCC